MTSTEDDQNALRAVELGAFDYYAKPVKLGDLKIMVQRAFHIYNLQQRLNENEPSPTPVFMG